MNQLIGFEFTCSITSMKTFVPLNQIVRVRQHYTQYENAPLENIPDKGATIYTTNGIIDVEENYDDILEKWLKSDNKDHPGTFDLSV